MLKKDTFGLKHVMPNKSLADFFEKSQETAVKAHQEAHHAKGSMIHRRT